MQLKYILLDAILLDAKFITDAIRITPISTNKRTNKQTNKQTNKRNKNFLFPFNVIMYVEYDMSEKVWNNLLRSTTELFFYLLFLLLPLYEVVFIVHTV